ncbi:MAG: hypothetical protein R3A52_21295 [Polyangiales bacterium]
MPRPASDQSNCGGCGVVCTGGRACISGTCTVTCATGFAVCTGVCRDLQNDRANCGGCGMACAAGQVCVSGACVASCATGFTNCSGACRDLSGDVNNCGMCGRVCAGGQTCTSGTCTVTCATGLTACSGVCRDTSTDINNCGMCGRACAAGQVCSAGTCQASCGTGLTNCSGACVNTQYDPANCGACGNACPARNACLAGQCRRLAGFSGLTGTAWASAPTTSSITRGLQAWVPSGQAYMYAGAGGDFGRLNIAGGTWENRAAAPVSLATWGSPAHALGDIWEIRGSAIVRYNPASNSWTTVRNDVTGGDSESMTVTDRDGNLWAANNATLVRYNQSTNTVSYFPTSVSTDLYETRVGYDENTHSIYFGGFAAQYLYRWDIATSTLTAMSPHPEGALNDIFCADRSGHIYAAGSFDGRPSGSSTSPPTPGGASSTSRGPGQQRLVLRARGRLAYIETGTLTQLYRIQLF